MVEKNICKDEGGKVIKHNVSYINLYNLIVILPLWLLFLGEHIVRYSESFSSTLKLLVFFLMIGNIFLVGKYNKYIIVLLFLFLTILFINIPKAFNIMAAIEEFLRFLFAPIFLLYGYTFRKKIDMFVNSIVFIAVFSDLFQIFTYFDYFMGIGIVEARVKDIGYIVNVGLFGITNAILNLSAFILTLKFNFTKYRKLLLVFFFIFTFLTFSYKTMLLLFLSLFIFIERRLVKILTLVLLCLFALISYKYVLDMYKVLLTKIDVYILTGNSARFESYRVMVEFLAQFNFLGEGLGSFGGPSSIKYNSPVYEKYNFNWFYTTNLRTTDTYYPHLFVELSWLGGFIFLLFLFLPIITTKNKEAKKIIIFLLLAILFDSLFSHGLNNMLYLSCTVLLFYGIRYKYERR